MPRRNMHADGLTRVRTLTAGMADVEEGTTFGFPAFKVGGKTFAWFPEKKEVEPGTLGVRISLLDREHLVGAQPSVYYVTPHYVDYPSVLARVDRLSDAALRELLESGREFVLAEGKRRKALKPRRPR